MGNSKSNSLRREPTPDDSVHARHDPTGSLSGAAVPRPPGSTTIFDVAKLAGVSIGTVSRVINNRNRVSPATRERVLSAIEALDFHANAFAQRLAARQSGTLGLVIPRVNVSMFFEIMRGVEDVATRAGYGLLIGSEPRHSSDQRYMNLFRRGYVDALILVASEVTQDHADEIVRRGILVTVVQQVVNDQVPAVGVDNYGGARALAEHLIGHGYRRFAYIAGSDFLPDNRERLRALRDVLSDHGLSLPPDAIAQGNYLQGSGYSAMRKLFLLPERPQAVMAANDQMAADAMQAAFAFGLRVPEDIAIVGFDDVPLASYITPPLTTVRQPFYDMGVYAAHVTLDRLKATLAASATPPPVPPRIVLPVTLVVRRSCGCG